MKILDFVRPELVVADLAATDKSGVLAELAGHVAAHSAAVAPEAPIDRAALEKVLIERERLASTAIGEGVAIPHGKMAVPRLVGCVGRSRAGVDFESPLTPGESALTYLFFVLVAPENSTGIHLKALARISRLFKDPDFRARLIQAPGAAEMYRVIADEDARY